MKWCIVTGITAASSFSKSAIMMFGGYELLSMDLSWLTPEVWLKSEYHLIKRERKVVRDSFVKELLCC